MPKDSLNNSFVLGFAAFRSSSSDAHGSTKVVSIPRLGPDHGENDAPGVADDRESGAERNRYARNRARTPRGSPKLELVLFADLGPQRFARRPRRFD